MGFFPRAKESAITVLGCVKSEGDGPERKCVDMYDKYKGVTELMPYAKGVSAKTYNFDEQGNCVEIDYNNMLSIVKQAGYTGYIGIEYEGDKLSEVEGVKATVNLLKKVGSSLS